MNCPGSVRATEGLPDDTSDAAAEGTAAHELAAYCLENNVEPSTFLEMWVDTRARDGAPKFVDLSEEPEGEDALRFHLINDEMVDSVEMYVNHVRGLPGELSVEQRLDITHIHPDIFGTGDAIIFDEEHAHLHVVDLKYGRGVVVEADENPQAVLYGSGAARRYHNRKIEKLTVYIVQPRAPHAKGPIRKYEIDLLGLFDHETDLTVKAAATDDPNAVFKAGPWCADTFCKLQATCAVNRAYRLAQAAAEFGTVDEETVFPDVETLTPEQEARVLREADGLLAYTKAVQARAHANAIAGRPPEGFKLVAKRANRKWLNEDEAKAKMLELAIEPYRPAKLKSPAMAESGFPGKNKEQRQKAMAAYVTKISSGTNLVPISDPRPAVKADAASEFGAVET
jgi:hypothetical protein